MGFDPKADTARTNVRTTAEFDGADRRPQRGAIRPNYLDCVTDAHDAFPDRAVYDRSTVKPGEGAFDQDVERRFHGSGGLPERSYHLVDRSYWRQVTLRNTLRHKRSVASMGTSAPGIGD